MLLLVIGAAALLPMTGVYSNAACVWSSDGPPSSSSSPLKTLSLSIRTPEVTTGVGLRARLEAGLKAKGVSDLVDNPHTYPRTQITVTEMDGRWTPFWARLRLKTNVVVDLKKDRKGHDTNVDVVVEGSCTGLVSKDEWQNGALDRVAAGVLAQIVP